MPRVSVIVPAYNVESFVAEALASARSQTYKDFEIVVVNDGSTDHTAQAIAPFFNEILYIEQENKGLAAARNAAIEAASGDLIALLDSDDVWTPNHLDRLVGYLEGQSQMLGVTSDSYLIRQTRYTNERIYRQLPPRWRFKATRQDYWITQYNFMQIHTVFRRALIDQYGSFDETLGSCEDWDLWTRALLAGERFGLVDEPLAYYRLREGSLSIDRANLLSDEITVLQKAISSGKSRRGASGRLSFSKGKLEMRAGRFDRARSHLLRAAADGGLFLPFRVKAVIGAIAPARAWSIYRRKTRG